MKTVLKYATYNTEKEVATAVNERIYPICTRSLVSISYVSETFLGSSNGRYIIWYNDEELEDSDR